MNITDYRILLFDIIRNSKIKPNDKINKIKYYIRKYNEFKDLNMELNKVIENKYNCLLRLNEMYIVLLKNERKKSIKLKHKK